MRVKYLLCLIGILLLMAGCQKNYDSIFNMKCTINGMEYKSPTPMFPLFAPPKIRTYQKNDSISLAVSSHCNPVNTEKGDTSYFVAIYLSADYPLVTGKKYDIVAPETDYALVKSFMYASYEELIEQVDNLTFYESKQLYSSGYVELTEFNLETKRVSGKFAMETANNTESSKNERKLTISGEFQGDITETL